MNKNEHINWLTLRDAQLKLTEELIYWDDSVEDGFIEAFADLMCKVLPMKEGEARDFWLENLKKMHLLCQRHIKIKHDYKKLERSYQTLYSEYQRVATILKEERKNF